MMNPTSSPRTVATDTGAEIITGGTGRRGQGTDTDRRSTERSPRFVPALPLTIAQVEQVLDTADATQLARALDPTFATATYSGTATFRCPCCRAKQAAALGRYHWRCEACQTLGTWIALRHEVACSVEGMVKLAGLVLGRQVLGERGAA